MAFGYPVFLDVHDVPVLLVGAGPIALRKAMGLLGDGARVTVVAPEVTAGFDDLDVTIRRKVYERSDMDGQQLVMTATNDPAVNATVAADARAANIWVNSADDPANCSFILPAIARRGPISVAVSTGGASPALARRIRDTIAESVLTPETAAAAVQLAAQRAAVHAAGGSTEDIDWTERVERALAGDDGAAPAL